jgi:putative sigma-54 modulation protein
LSFPAATLGYPAKGEILQIAVASRNLEVTELLRSTVEEKITRLTRFLEGMERAEVRFSEERNPRISEREVCEVTMHGHGHVVRAKAGAADPFAAVDLVVDKLEHRMEKLKGKLLGRTHGRRGKPSLDSVPGAAISALPFDEATDEGVDGRQPRIVKTKQFAMKPMTAEEAVLQMELVGHEFFLFTSADNGRASVVYRRHDREIGLIEAT